MNAVPTPARRLERRPLPPDGGDLPADLHPVLARVLRARRVSGASALDLSLAGLLPWTGLSGIEAAVDRLLAARRRGESVLVVGDFDADGATASAVALRGLRMLGFESVDFLVPNRFEFGYGLTPEIVAVAAGRRPDVIVTVDNGISSIEGVAAAGRHGIDVIVTDHHVPGEALPAAAAIVNPNRPGDAFPSKCLAGVGVAFYVLAGVRAALREANAFGAGAQPNLGTLLDLVALGTVADLVPLDHNNRILVEQGLRRIRSGRASPGLAALLAVGKRDARHASASDLAFAAAPRLNAAGRLTDMSLGIECLLATEASSAAGLASRLDALNRERREIEAGMTEEAMAVLDARLALREGELPFGLVLHDAAWHPGVIGILAARVRERVHRPVVVCAPDGDDLVRGSARSVPGLHLRDLLARIDALNPGLLVRFGGHAMAAGLTLARERLDEFANAFDAELGRQLRAEDLSGVVWTDGELGAEDIGLPLARALSEAGPWGQGFPEPLFEGEFAVRARRTLTGGHLKLDLDAGAGRSVDAIAFRREGTEWPHGHDRLRIAYRLDVNRWRGEERVQLVVEHVEPPAGEPAGTM